MPPFKDEHVLIIAPGSQRTLAQLGLPESFTPAKLRVPTRMFPAEIKGTWEPHKVREKRKSPQPPQPPQASAPALSAREPSPPTAAATGNEKQNGTEQVKEEAEGTVEGDSRKKSEAGKPVSEETAPTDGASKAEGDVEMQDAGDPQPAEAAVETNAAGEVEEEEEEEVEEDEDEVVHFEEDLVSEEGAVYPLKEGRVTDWSCFLALLNHIHNTLSPPFHTPILLITQPSWTQQDHETVTQFFFEKFKTPAFCLLDSALAVCYAYGIPTATVVDVGYEKTDVTAVSEFVVHDVGRGVAVSECGGETMTQRLLELLGPKGWTREMCEQLKKSNICEILPKDVPLPISAEAKAVDQAAAAAAAGQGLVAGAGAGDDDEEMGDLKDVVDGEGILDVAAIVTSGKTQEFLARKDKEKAERDAAKKAAAEAAAGPVRPTRLPNSRREKNVFMYEERRDEPETGGEKAAAAAPMDVATEPSAEVLADLLGDEPSSEKKDEEEAKEAKPSEAAQANPAQEAAPVTTAKAAPEAAPEASEAAPEAASEAAGPSAEESGATRRQQEKAARKEERRRNRARFTGVPGLVRKEVEVGTERFQCTSGNFMDRLADAIFRTVLSVPEVNKRGDLWDSLVIVGNGCRVRGFKDALVSTLTTKYLISPSSATIFTSELPSNLSTPLATGANTPQPQLASASASTSALGGPSAGGSSSVNPLLLAATTASNHAAALTQGSPHVGQAGISNSIHTSHGHQTPTSIKLPKIPDYFPEWKDAGFEEAAFLGAQVAAKVVFVIDQGISKGFMTRSEYNELGPSGIHEFYL
ncbi:MAG: Actin-like protein arp9 (SWI/SNF complex component arp9) [Thelocarpon superellum]|nr:MAG: Actin-like protein arp9 (SWI/SNF complex component arp9) [Thelocarpon superellum]